MRPSVLVTDLDVAISPKTRSSPGSRRERLRLRSIATGAVLALAISGLGGWTFYRSRHALEPLQSAGVAIGPGGERVILGPGPLVPLIPGTRVLASAGAAGAARAAEQRDWLAAGTIPDAPVQYQDMVRTALLDLNTLLLPDGAAVAGWPSFWRYVWPRDASMIAVALSRTGHPDDARSVLLFLQRQLPPSGVFRARYRPDGSGVPDARSEQTDGTGWVLWAAAQVVNDLPAGAARTAFLTQLRPLIDGSTRAALRITDRPSGLPEPSQDYWEVRDDRLSLGTAAPLAFGLDAAVKLQRLLGDDQLAAQAQERAGVLRASIVKRFGSQGYPRYLGDDEIDAAVAFLLPPFTEQADPEVVQAWRRAAGEMSRPAGGISPGVGWKNDGISWTPQTALFALTAASIGDRTAANGWLTWLAQHRTQYGALPEKVLSNGDPAGPAPLAWTDAFVLLAVDALSRAKADT
jgi:glucoamylase